jgi:hypothetical protein
LDPIIRNKNRLIHGFFFLESPKLLEDGEPKIKERVSRRKQGRSKEEARGSQGSGREQRKGVRK